MSLRRSQRLEAEERKKRQEKFRKRTRSLYNKTRLLAKDTDAWVALIVRDRAGRVQSFRSSGSRYWPPSIQDLMTAHPSGAHEFLEKHAVAGCWKEVAEDESDTALVDGDAESVDEDDPVISMIPETEPDSTISVDQWHVGKDADDGASTSRDKSNEAVDLLRGPESTPPLQLGEPDGLSVDVGQLDDAIVDAPENSGNPSVDSPRQDAALDMLGDTIFEIEEFGDMTVDMIEESNNTTIDMVVSSHNTTGNSGNVPDVPSEAIALDMGSTAEPGSTTSEYDMMDVDVTGAKNRAQPDVREGESVEAANTLFAMSQYHNPPSGGLGGWQVVNRPRIGPKELLENWNWVFQN